MKKLTLCLLILVAISSELIAQESPFLQVETKRNFFNQKLIVLEGPKQLQKEEVMTLMASNPEALVRYEQAMRKQTISVALSAVEVGLFVGTMVFIFAPQQQSSTMSNLFWPLSIGTVVVGIASGVYRRSAGNLTREAVDLYNFGSQNGPPVYFQDNRIDQPIFSFKIPIR
ncbi:hypothetical protein [Algoriphagus litoralis]|uniref:hypothetical protein n=1 Tax=Algoriphagus litoralis TaxID=2202829 RepID=UPI000DBAD44F|nr:hypothetical protein [Algoriphagus litoralis]